MPVTASPQITIIPLDATVTLDAIGKLKGLLSLDFDAHDQRLEQCLLSATDTVQQYTGLVLTPSTVEVAYSELYDWEDLPGPVANGTTYTGTSYAGRAITLPTLRGSFPKLVGNYPAGVVITYQAGYEVGTVPFAITEAILNLAANLFDEGSRGWQHLVAPYRRTTWAS